MTRRGCPLVAFDRVSKGLGRHRDETALPDYLRLIITQSPPVSPHCASLSGMAAFSEKRRLKKSSVQTDNRASSHAIPPASPSITNHHGLCSCYRWRRRSRRVFGAFFSPRAALDSYQDHLSANLLLCAGASWSCRVAAIAWRRRCDGQSFLQGRLRTQDEQAGGDLDPVPEVSFSAIPYASNPLACAQPLPGPGGRKRI